MKVAHLKPILHSISAVVFGLGLMASDFAVAQVTPHSEAKTAQMLLQAQEAMQKQDCIKAKPALDYLWDDKSLSTSDPDLANEMRINLILCALNDNEVTQAIALSEKNIARPDSNIMAYVAHAIILESAGRTDEALAALTTGIGKHSTEVPKLNERPLFDMAIKFHDTPQKLVPFVTALERAHYLPRNGFVSSYFATIHLEGLRHSKDSSQSALHRAAIARSAEAYMIMMGDGRLSKPDEPALDVAAIVQNDMQSSMAYLIDNSTDLTALLEVMGAMQHLRQDEQLSGLTKVMIEAVERDGIDNFGSDYYYSRLLSTRALALADMGRHDEAIAAFEDGYAKLADHDLNDFMGEYLNYLTDMGDEVRALALLETMDLKTLDEGNAKNFARIESCAAFYASDKPRSDAALARIPVGNFARLKPYLCRGEDDLAAKTLIANMADPKTRDDAIMYMQDTKPAVPWSQRDQQYVDHLTALKKRPDVLQAAANNQILIRAWPIW